MKIERFVDSHTEGEPTRVLLAPDGGLFQLTLPELLVRWTHDGVLQIPPECLALAANPRAADATVCALVCRGSKPGAMCGVLFWNASAPLGMCGHATIGLARTLVHLGFELPARAIVETRVGDVVVRVLEDGRIAFDNVVAHIHARDVEVVLDQGGVARGELSPGAVWRQESAISSMFEARYAVVEADVEAILPTIAGRAFLVAEGSFVHDAADPSRGGGWKEVR